MPVNKEFIKQLEKKEYNGKFQTNCSKALWITSSIFIASIIGFASVEAICPPVATALLVLSISSIDASFGSATLSDIKTRSEYFSNKEFNEQKVIDELKLEEDSD